MSGDEHAPDDDGGGLSDRAAFYISGVFGLVLATASVWYVGERALWFEALWRVRPDVSGGGVGADWEAGLELVALNWAIDLIHYADIVMGTFILLMVFIHWAAFLRLGDRMQPPASRETDTGAVATDGGEEE